MHNRKCKKKIKNKKIIYLFIKPSLFYKRHDKNIMIFVFLNTHVHLMLHGRIPVSIHRYFCPALFSPRFTCKRFHSVLNSLRQSCV